MIRCPFPRRDTNLNWHLILETRILLLHCLEVRLLDTEIPSKRLNNLTKYEADAVCSLKGDKIIIKCANKSAIVIVCDLEDYLKEARKQLQSEDKHMYFEVPNDPSALARTIFKSFQK